MKVAPQSSISRRTLLLSSAVLLWSTTSKAYSTPITGVLPWTPNAGTPATPMQLGLWHFFTDAEGAIVEALADRVIPPDAETPGGRESGSAIFVD